VNRHNADDAAAPVGWFTAFFAAKAWRSEENLLYIGEEFRIHMLEFAFVKIGTVET
jgi:hypothetical protein